MSDVFVPVRSVKQYFKEFAIDGIGKGADKNLIKEQLLDAFQKEIFGQITMKYHDAAILAKFEEVPDDVKNGVGNILKNSMRKWRRLCILFAGYRETRMLIDGNDLIRRVNEVISAQSNPDICVEDDGTLVVTKGV